MERPRPVPGPTVGATSARTGGPPLGLTVAQAARLMRVSNMTVYRLIRSGSLKALRVGNRYVLQEADVHAYLTESYFRVV
ncbi:MAG: helix-turn-helix domain-containing protein [Actinomycetota bacterium]